MSYPNLPENVNSVSDIEKIAQQYNIPLREKCRFFINEDYREPKAFGIYFDGEDWIVYKNKANGERAVRYKGKSEKYAAQEIWDKFLDETDSRRGKISASSKNDKLTKSGAPVWVIIMAGIMVLPFYGTFAYSLHNSTGVSFWIPATIIGIFYAIGIFIFSKKSLTGGFLYLVLGVFAIGAIVIVCNGAVHQRHDGAYYRDGNQDYYYRQGDDWYVYDNDSDYWSPYYDSYDEFDETEYFDGESSFYESGYYDPYNDTYLDFSDLNIESGSGSGSGSSSSDSSDSSWDDWDSSDTDWDSDW